MRQQNFLPAQQHMFMNHDTKKLKGIIIHSWSTKRIYNVNHLRKIVIDRYPRVIESDFTIELGCIEDNEQYKVWEINKTSPVIKNVDDKDKSLQLLRALEEFTYPIKVKVDGCGNFLELYNHAEWVENWRIKAKKLAQEEYDVDGNVEIFQQFYEILLDQQKFLDNKNRESFWKLLFLNFRIAVPLDEAFSSKESFSWDLLQLGTAHIKGKVAGIVSERKFVQQYSAKELLAKDMIQKATDTYKLKPVEDIYSPTIDFKVDIITEEGTRKLISKKAVLDLVIEDKLNYKEEINIIFNDEIA